MQAMTQFHPSDRSAVERIVREIVLAQTGARNAQIRAGGAGSQYLDVRSPMIAVADQTNVGGGPFPDYLNAGSYLELMVSATVANAASRGRTWCAATCCCCVKATACPPMRA